MKTRTVVARTRILACFNHRQPWGDIIQSQVPVTHWKCDENGNQHGLILNKGEFCQADSFPNFAGYEYPPNAIKRITLPAPVNEQTFMGTGRESPPPNPRRGNGQFRSPKSG